MSHHLFLLSPTDTPIYSLAHQSTKSTAPTTGSTLSANLPAWSTSAFAGTLTALSGAQSAGSSTTQNGGATKIGAGQDRHVIQMIANASLDVIEEMVVTNSGMYLKSVDKFNEWTISAFVTPGNMKFVLLHEARNEEGIKLFFMEVWELYVKPDSSSRSHLMLGCFEWHTPPQVRAIPPMWGRTSRLFTVELTTVVTMELQTAMNPFFRSDKPIKSTIFDTRVRASAKKHL